jgi:hypothetical protein
MFTNPFVWRVAFVPCWPFRSLQAMCTIPSHRIVLHLVTILLHMIDDYRKCNQHALSRKSKGSCMHVLAAQPPKTTTMATKMMHACTHCKRRLKYIRLSHTRQRPGEQKRHPRCSAVVVFWTDDLHRQRLEGRTLERTLSGVEHTVTVHRDLRSSPFTHACTHEWQRSGVGGEQTDHHPLID